MFDNFKNNFIKIWDYIILHIAKNTFLPTLFYKISNMWSFSNSIKKRSECIIVKYCYEKTLWNDIK